jgi:hypothetical protein
MKKTLTVLFVLIYFTNNSNAQNCNLVITPTPNCPTYSDQNVPGYVCGARQGGGAATITGGTAPYNTSTPGAIIVGNTITLKCFGNCSPTPVTITDANNCTATLNLSLCPNVFPTMYNFTVTKKNTTCNGINDGSISAAYPIGSAPPNSPIPLPPNFMYHVSGLNGTNFPIVHKLIGSTLSNLAPGSYLVQSDYFMCATNPGGPASPNPPSEIVTINACLPLTLTSSVITPAICTAKATGKVVATGAAGNYTYSWNTTPVQTTATATNLDGGNSYTCTVTSGNSTQGITVNIPPPTSTNFVATIKDRVVNKYNFYYDVYINGVPAPNTGYTYLWSTGATTKTIPHGINCLGCGPVTTTVAVKDQYGCTSNATIVMPGSTRPKMDTQVKEL